jgi:hypothetical protein
MLAAAVVASAAAVAALALEREIPLASRTTPKPTRPEPLNALASAETPPAAGVR